MASVFILDDDRDIRELFPEMFKLLGAADCYAFSSVAEMQASGGKALGCKLAVLDVNLGAGLPTGLDALAWLTSNRFGGKIVFLTGHARANQSLSQAEKMGPVKVYEKPVGMEDLAAMLKSVL